MKSDRKSTIQVTLGHIPVKILRKPIKYIRLRIVPPHHEVRISVPQQMPIEMAQALGVCAAEIRGVQSPIAHRVEMR